MVRDDAERVEPIVITIPLENGRIDVAEHLRQAIADAGFESSEAFAQITWLINVRSIAGRAQLQAIEHLSDSIVTFEITDQTAALHFDQQALRQRAQDATGWFSSLLNLDNQDTAHWFGIFMINQDQSVRKLTSGDSAPGHVVILVHGLDDPGWLWDDMIIALQSAGYLVARFEYPNDGPIGGSADLLAEELRLMRDVGVRHVDVVAHSMGGLVCRDVLTRALYYHGNGAGNDELPSVDHLIMLGTPNHGSPLAQLRSVTEISEQLTRAFNGDGFWQSAFTDGRGEAGVELMPGSRLLKRLNSRELPSHTNITIVAGQASMLDKSDVERLERAITRVADSGLSPAWLQSWLDNLPGTVGDALAGVVDGIGDGAVSIDSTRLEGVEDHVTIAADHISMIINSGDTTAPAIPIVLDRLAAKRPLTPANDN